MLVQILLAVSVVLNLYLWHRLRTAGRRIPQYAIDRINELTAKLDAGEARLRAAQQDRQP